MITITRPQPPRPMEPAETAAAVEVLIAEARARARRRHSIYVVVVLLALVGSLPLVTWRSGPSVTEPSVQAPDPSAAAAAGTDDPTSILAAQSVRAGWAFVYGDGRVLGYRDATDPIDPTVVGQLVERRLTVNGLNQVRSGAVTPFALLVTISAPPGNLWADLSFRPYVPSRHAACSRGMDGWPATVQALLRGRQRIDLVNPFPPNFRGPVFFDMCSDLSTDEVVLVLAALQDAGFAHIDEVTSRPLGACARLGPNESFMCFHPILPHRSWVPSGG